jgi:hypothetical protein
VCRYGADDFGGDAAGASVSTAALLPVPTDAATTWGSTYKPFCLSSETVLPIKRNRSTHQVKPFHLSSETVLPIA